MHKDPTVRHWFKDEHNHEDGICDLEEWLSAPVVYSPKVHCYRNISRTSPNLCGCKMCTGQLGRKWSRRMERAAWRSIKQDLLKTLSEDLEDIDVPPIHKEHWGW